MGRTFLHGIVFAAGMLATALTAVSLSGTLATFASGDIVSASQINQNFTVIESTLSGMNSTPLGSIVAWHKGFPNAPSIPEGWVECNGQTISDNASVFNGQTVPDLNNDAGYGSGGYFLRGATSSGTTQTDTFQGHWHERQYLNGATQNWAEGGSNVVGGCCGQGNYYSDFRITDPITGNHGAPRFGNETRPINMSVVWIIRIK